MNKIWIYICISTLALYGPGVYAGDMGNQPNITIEEVDDSTLPNAPSTPQFINEDGSTTAVPTVTHPNDDTTLVPAQPQQQQRSKMAPHIFATWATNDGQQGVIAGDPDALINDLTKVADAVTGTVINKGKIVIEKLGEKVLETGNKLQKDLPAIVEATVAIGATAKDAGATLINQAGNKAEKSGMKLINQAATKVKEVLNKVEATAGNITGQLTGAANDLKAITNMTPEQLTALNSTPEGQKLLAGINQNLEASANLQNVGTEFVENLNQLLTQSQNIVTGFIANQQATPTIALLPAGQDFEAMTLADQQEVQVQLLTFALQAIQKAQTSGGATQGFINLINQVSKLPADEVWDPAVYGSIKECIEAAEQPAAPAAQGQQPGQPLLLGWHEQQAADDKKPASPKDIKKAADTLQKIVDPTATPASSSFFNVSTPFMIFAGCTLTVGIVLIAKKAYQKWKKKKEKEQKQQQKRAEAQKAREAQKVIV